MRHSLHRPSVLVTVALFTTFAAMDACTPVLTTDDVKLVAKEIRPVSSAAFSAVVGSTVTSQPTVRVFDQDGEPFAGVTVAFSASAGSQPTPASVMTLEDGSASVSSWTLPLTIGTIVLSASVPGHPAPSAPFTVTVTAGPATSATGSPANQQGIAGQAVSQPPSVLVQDQHLNPVSGVAVTFTIQGGGGTIAGSSTSTVVNTDATGTAKPAWILGSVVGTNTVTATVAGLSGNPITFTANGIAGPAANIVIAPGAPTSQGQTAIAQTTAAVAPAVVVTDANDNPTGNIAVRFAVIAGGGKVLTSASDVTGANTVDIQTTASGHATSFGWKLGSLGANSLSVTVPSASGLAPFVITATGIAGAPKTVALLGETPSSNNQTGIIGEALTVDPAVVVGDSLGNVVAGASVVFTVAAGSGTIRGTSSSSSSSTATIQTNVAGVARIFEWRPESKGGNNLTAALQSDATASFTFAATGTAGPPASTVINPESPSSCCNTTIANTNVQFPPAIQVRDANGITVDGAAIRFDIIAGGGAISATIGGIGGTTATVNTDADGVARLGYWRPGTVGPGANTVLATVVSNTSLSNTYSATGTVGPPTQIEFVNRPWQFVRPSMQVGGVARVRVRDVGGNPLSGVTVDWGNAGCSCSTVGGPTTSATDGAGVATFGGTWTAGATTNEQIDLHATVQGVSPTLAAVTSSRTVGAPSSDLSFGLNTEPTTTVNTTVTSKPVLTLRDGQNLPIPGFPIAWSITANPNTADLSNPQVLTDSLGRADAGNWRVSQTAGINTIRADATETSVFFLFSTTAVAGPAASIAINGGNNQSAAPSAPVATPPSVIVKDAFNNLVGSNVLVTFQPAAGSGSVTGSPTNTGSNSIATVGSWTLGPALGPQTLNAFLTGNPSVTTSFAATAAGTVTKLMFTVQPPANAGYLIDMAPGVRVAVQDAAGNTVTSYNTCIGLTLSSNPGGATLIGGDPINTVDGVATFPGLRLDRPSNGYVLTATQTCGTGAPTAAVSQAFNVTPTGTVASSSGPQINGMVLHGSTIYFTVSGAASGKVKKVSASGGVVTELAGALSQPAGIVSDGTNVYWIETADGATNQGRVARMSVDGGTVSTVAGGLTFTNGGHWLFADGADLFFLAGNIIKKIAASATLGTPSNHVETFWHAVLHDPRWKHLLLRRLAGGCGHILG